MDDNSMHDTLKRIEALLLIIVRTQLGPILEKELADDRMRQLYELTGSITANDAAKKLKCSATKIVEAWPLCFARNSIYLDGWRLKTMR
jgi:hypothetical protein